jgi:serine/threonine protein kinase
VLFRSLTVMAKQTGAATESDDVEVAGTPAYMSPEQSLGLPNLDCRSDIYSLGAMLYQLTTGKLLFASHSEHEVMELQVSGTAPDPLDVNPALSKPMCWLIEKMLAKKAEDRHKDWAAVKADLQRVRRGQMPAGRPLGANASTVGRSRKRAKGSQATRRSVIASKDGESPFFKFVVGIGLAAILIVGLSILVVKKSPPPRPEPPEEHVVPPTGSVPDTDFKARAKYDVAQAWALEHTNQFDEAISQFRMVSRGVLGSTAEELDWKSRNTNPASTRSVLSQSYPSPASSMTIRTTDLAVAPSSFSLIFHNPSPPASIGDWCRSLSSRKTLTLMLPCWEVTSSMPTRHTKR